MLDEKQREKELRAIERFRMFDDTFMSAVFDGQIAETELLLNIVLEKSDITVISSKSQYYLSNLKNRELRLDIYAKDGKNMIYHVEVQRDRKGASVKRARFTAALVDSKLLTKGQGFDEMPERYTIFIVEDDMFEKGIPAYHAMNKITELDNKILGDGGHIIYINGQYKNLDTPIGELMHDFFCTDPDDIINPILRRRVKYLKEMKGGREKMCEIMDELTKDRINDEKIELAKEAIKEGDLSLERIASFLKIPLSSVEELAKGMVTPA